MVWSWSFITCSSFTSFMKLCCELTFSICITSRQLYASYMKYYTHHTSSKCVLTSFSINQSRGSVRSRGTNANRYDLRKIPSTSSSSDAWSGRQICPRHTHKKKKKQHNRSRRWPQPVWKASVPVPLRALIPIWNVPLILSHRFRRWQFCS